jgi:hypothetical protein
MHAMKGLLAAIPIFGMISDDSFPSEKMGATGGPNLRII